MSNDDTKLDAVAGFQFMGRINASLSHDISNVFATINELVGLLDDMLVAQQQGRELDPARIQRTNTRIVAQIARGQELIKQLNRFAHSVDKPGLERDLCEVVSDIVTLCQRFARLRRVELVLAPSSTPLPIVGNAFTLQQRIFAALELALDCADDRSRIDVSTENTATAVIVKVHVLASQNLSQAQQDKLTLWQNLCQQFGNTCEYSAPQGGASLFALVLPKNA